MTKVDYKNFYELLKIEDKQKKESQLKELINTHLKNYFFNDNRKWFNELIHNGLVNLVKYCEETIENFSLYDKKEKSDSFSNVSFLWSINSGNIELIKYFINHKDFSKFCKNKNLEQKISNHIYENKTKDNYGEIIELVVKTFPKSIPIIIERNILNQKNDEMYDVLMNLLKRYKNELSVYMQENDGEDGNNFTRLCMASVNSNNFKFAKEFRKKYTNIEIKKEQASFLLLFQHNIKALDFIIKNPDFYKLEKTDTKNIFNIVFSSPINKALSKEDYDFIFLLTKNKLYEVNYGDMQRAIMKDLTPFVKKYYKKFKSRDFNLTMNNKSTVFIREQQKIQQYHDLKKEMQNSNTIEYNNKKMKI